MATSDVPRPVIAAKSACITVIVQHVKRLASSPVQCLNPCDVFAIGMHLAYEATVIASKYQTVYIVVVHAAVSALAAHAKR